MGTPGGDTAYGSGNGFFANGSGMSFLPGTTGLKSNASIVGLLRYRNTDVDGVSAAVVGIDQTDETDGVSKNYGAYISGRTYLGGKIETIDETSTLKEGITVEYDVRVGGQDFYKMKWVNGILVSSVKQ